MVAEEGVGGVVGGEDGGGVGPREVFQKRPARMGFLNRLVFVLI